MLERKSTSITSKHPKKSAMNMKRQVIEYFQTNETDILITFFTGRRDASLFVKNACLIDIEEWMKINNTKLTSVSELFVLSSRFNPDSLLTDQSVNSQLYKQICWKDF